MSRGDGIDPERETLLADSIGLALLVVLETLTPAERLAFVLHDLFDMPFDEIAPIVGRSPTAARQLASRARRRVQGQGQPPIPMPISPASERWSTPSSRPRAAVTSMALLAVLDPDVVVRSDRKNMLTGASREVRGASEVARQFVGRAQDAQPALVNGAVGLVWAPGGQPRVVFGFTITRGKIVAIEMLADPARILQLDVAILGN